MSLEIVQRILNLEKTVKSLEDTVKKYNEEVIHALDTLRSAFAPKCRNPECNRQAEPDYEYCFYHVTE